MIGHIKAGYGYWDVTVHPRGGAFHRANGDMAIHGIEVVARYNNGDVKEITALTDERRRVCVPAESCCLYASPVCG